MDRTSKDVELGLSFFIPFLRAGWLFIIIVNSCEKRFSSVELFLLPILYRPSGTNSGLSFHFKMLLYDITMVDKLWFTSRHQQRKGGLQLEETGSLTVNNCEATQNHKRVVDNVVAATSWNYFQGVGDGQIFYGGFAVHAAWWEFQTPFLISPRLGYRHGRNQMRLRKARMIVDKYQATDNVQPFSLV